MYDNLRSAVLDRRGAAVQFHPRLLELAGHYHFAPHPCTAGRPNEKGKIERQIRYLREAFFAARPFRRPRRHQRPVPTLARRGRTSAAAPRAARPQVSPTSGKRRGPACCRCPPIPSRPTWCAPSAPARPLTSASTATSTRSPHTHVRKPLTLLASATRIRILDGQNELACHHRTYDTGLTVEDPAHLEGLLAATRQANVPHHPRPGSAPPVPNTAMLFERLAQRAEALRPHATRLLALLDDYGPEELAKAVDIALERDALGAGSITHILETRRRQRGLKPPLRLTLPDRPGLRDLDVQPHDLETYDALGRHDHDDDAAD